MVNFEAARRSVWGRGRREEEVRSERKSMCRETRGQTTVWFSFFWGGGDCVGGWGGCVDRLGCYFLIEKERIEKRRRKP